MQVTKVFEDRSIRLIIKDGIPFFCAKDACDALFLENTSQALLRLEKEDIVDMKCKDSSGREQKMKFVRESGLYNLIFNSRLESAKKFKRWVFEEVLPQLRKTGKYSIPDKLKKKSTEDRNNLTSEWKKHGVSHPLDYRKLTLTEYESLGFDKDKRKPDMDRGELLLLNALESMERLKLFYDDSIEGVEQCAVSVTNTAKIAKQLTPPKKELQEVTK